MQAAATALAWAKTLSATVRGSVPPGARRRVLFVAAAAFAFATGGLWAYARVSAPPALAGTVVTPPVRAHDFRLSDEHGRRVALTNFQGKAVALTFLYARCPDTCPLVAELMRATYQKLGSTAGRVAFVAVSVDPEGDTPDAIQRFLKAHRVEGVLTYLRGSFAELRPIWGQYYVGSDAGEVNPGAVAASRPRADLIGHTSIIYVIDPQGRIRAFLPGNFEPTDLAKDLRLLVEHRGRGPWSHSGMP